MPETSEADVGIYATLELQREAWIASLQSAEQEADEFAQRISQIRAEISITADDQITAAVERIASDLSSREIQIEITADDELTTAIDAIREEQAAEPIVVPVVAEGGVPAEGGSRQQEEQSGDGVSGGGAENEVADTAIAGTAAGGAVRAGAVVAGAATAAAGSGVGVITADTAGAAGGGTAEAATAAAAAKGAASGVSGLLSGLLARIVAFRFAISQVRTDASLMQDDDVMKDPNATDAQKFAAAKRATQTEGSGLLGFFHANPYIVGGPIGYLYEKYRKDHLPDTEKAINAAGDSEKKTKELEKQEAIRKRISDQLEKQQKLDVANLAIAQATDPYHKALAENDKQRLELADKLDNAAFKDKSGNLTPAAQAYQKSETAVLDADRANIQRKEAIRQAEYNAKSLEDLMRSTGNDAGAALHAIEVRSAEAMLAAGNDDTLKNAARLRSIAELREFIHKETPKAQSFSDFSDSLKYDQFIKKQQSNGAGAAIGRAQADASLLQEGGNPFLTTLSGGADKLDKAATAILQAAQTPLVPIKY